MKTFLHTKTVSDTSFIVLNATKHPNNNQMSQSEFF